MTTARPSAQARSACAGFFIGLPWLDYLAHPSGLVVGFVFMPLVAILGAVGITLS